MGLLFVDGWDHYADATPLTAKWQTEQGAAIFADSGRRGSGALIFSALSDSYVTQFIGAQAVWHIGFAFRLDHVGEGANDLFSLLIDGTTVVCRLVLEPDGTLAYYAGAGGEPLANPAIALAENLWYHVTLHIDLTEDLGVVHIWLDSVTIIDLEGTVEEPLQAGAGTSATAIRLGSTESAADPHTGVRFDDFYCADGDSDPMGDCRVDTLYPVGAGTYQDWSPIPPDAATHWGLLDERPPNTTDYVRNDVEGDRETVLVGILAPLVNAPIFGVQMNAFVAKDDAGVSGVQTLIKSGTAELVGPATALGVSWRYLLALANVDPDTELAWTDSGIALAEFGLVTATVS